MTIYEYLRQGISNETELYAYYLKHKDEIIAIDDEYKRKIAELKGRIIKEFMEEKGLAKEASVSTAFYNYMNGVENKFIEKTLQDVDYEEMKQLYIKHILDTNL